MNRDRTIALTIIALTLLTATLVLPHIIERAVHQYYQALYEEVVFVEKIAANAENKIRSGELKPDDIKSEIEDGRKVSEAMIRMLGSRVIQTPDYLARLFRFAVKRHPEVSKTSPFLFRLIICNDCGTSSLADGTVFLSANSIRDIQNEAELVWLMGHEITHVAENHVGESDAVRRYVLERANGLARVDVRYCLKVRSDGLKQQIRADAGGVETLKKAGYDPCSAHSYATRRKYSDPERMDAIRESAMRETCRGDIFKIGNEQKLEEAKREIGTAK